MKNLSYNSDDFFQRVLDKVKLIPKGKVATYGDIAAAVGLRSSARTVGWALNTCNDLNKVPCHRVVNRYGELTGKKHFPTPGLMREMLENEGIEFIDERVNLNKHLWKPEIE